MINFRTAAILLSAVALASCDKNAAQVIDAPASGSYIRFFNFGMSSPGVNFYADGTKVTAIAFTTTDTLESTSGTNYGGVANGGLYSALTPGAHTFTARITANTDKGLVVATQPATIEDGKHYSLYTAGFYNTTAKTIESFVVEDPIPETIDFSQAMVRFVNASPNSAPVTLYAKDQVTGVETAIGGSVAYKSAGTFTGLPQSIYDLTARTATTTVFTRLGVGFNAGRMYTITARGDVTVTSTTATNRPFLDNTANR